jgi:hypothetical protein
MLTINAEHAFLDQTTGPISTVHAAESMQDSTLQQKVKQFRARRRDVVHQKCLLDRQKMTARGWRVYCWGEIDRDFFWTADRRSSVYTVMSLGSKIESTLILTPGQLLPH